MATRSRRSSDQRFGIQADPEPRQPPQRLSLPLPTARRTHLDASRHQRRADGCWSRAELLRDCRERRTLDIPEHGALYLLPCQSSALVAERNAPALADLADRGAMDVEALSDLLDRDASLLQLNNFELLLDRQV